MRDMLWLVVAFLNLLVGSLVVVILLLCGFGSNLLTVLPGAVLWGVLVALGLAAVELLVVGGLWLRAGRRRGFVVGERGNVGAW